MPGINETADQNSLMGPMGVRSFDLGNSAAFFPLYSWNIRCSGEGYGDRRDVQMTDDPQRASVLICFIVVAVIGRNLMFPVVPELVAK